MNTINDLSPLLLKAALLIPAALIFAYLAYHEVWVPLTKLQDNYARFQEIPRKTRKDHIQFWVLGKLPETRARQWHESERDAA